MRRRASLVLLAAAVLAAPAWAQDTLADLLRRHFNEDLKVEAVRPFGPVSVVLVEFARRANSHEQWLVVAAGGRVVELLTEASRLAHDAEAPLRAAHPQAMLGAGSQVFLRREALPEGGQRLLFALPVMDGCRACGVVGIARIGIDVDAGGHMRAARLIDTFADPGADWADDPRL